MSFVETCKRGRPMSDAKAAEWCSNRQANVDFCWENALGPEMVRVSWKPNKRISRDDGYMSRYDRCLSVKAKTFATAVTTAHDLELVMEEADRYEGLNLEVKNAPNVP